MSKITKTCKMTKNAPKIEQKRPKHDKKCQTLPKPAKMTKTPEKLNRKIERPKNDKNCQKQHRK